MGTQADLSQRFEVNRMQNCHWWNTFSVFHWKYTYTLYTHKTVFVAEEKIRAYES